MFIYANGTLKASQTLNGLTQGKYTAYENSPYWYIWVDFYANFKSLEVCLSPQPQKSAYVIATTINTFDNMQTFDAQVSLTTTSGGFCYGPLRVFSWEFLLGGQPQFQFGIIPYSVNVYGKATVAGTLQLAPNVTNAGFGFYNSPLSFYGNEGHTDFHIAFSFDSPSSPPGEGFSFIVSFLSMILPENESKLLPEVDICRTPGELHQRHSERKQPRDHVELRHDQHQHKWHHNS